uniref:Uncharacterized protein n=1 Tax=Chromera velia CCMP2878 TaxID=1169474 RepID=A0A0G4IEP9_9ALVE|eukprot:Cvel_13719.t1-p1 / transcript=Cvel_13719.t1 / gene=Cvel_13719 / organism=Chromera_velia_CCMP2878 / gene_product=hypothetical protein / transcript_product=hypothetical protein / location=Cvel_scaffold948:35885-38321(+) / protein_length=653 / sequence_SO=supercontig / SO=protein_coding / is_pseudo=false
METGRYLLLRMPCGFTMYMHDTPMRVFVWYLPTILLVLVTHGTFEPKKTADIWNLVMMVLFAALVFVSLCFPLQSRCGRVLVLSQLFITTTHTAAKQGLVLATAAKDHSSSIRVLFQEFFGFKLEGVFFPPCMWCCLLFVTCYVSRAIPRRFTVAEARDYLKRVGHRVPTPSPSLSGEEPFRDPEAQGAGEETAETESPGSSSSSRVIRESSRSKSGVSLSSPQSSREAGEGRGGVSEGEVHSCWGVTHYFVALPEGCGIRALSTTLSQLPSTDLSTRMQEDAKGERDQRRKKGWKAKAVSSWRRVTQWGGSLVDPLKWNDKCVTCLFCRKPTADKVDQRRIILLMVCILIFIKFYADVCLGTFLLFGGCHSVPLPPDSRSFLLGLVIILLTLGHLILLFAYQFQHQKVEVMGWAGAFGPQFYRLAVVLTLTDVGVLVTAICAAVTIAPGSGDGPLAGELHMFTGRLVMVSILATSLKVAVKLFLWLKSALLMRKLRRENSRRMQKLRSQSEGVEEEEEREEGGEDENAKERRDEDEEAGVPVDVEGREGDTKGERDHAGMMTQKTRGALPCPQSPSPGVGGVLILSSTPSEVPRCDVEEGAGEDGWEMQPPNRKPVVLQEQDGDTESFSEIPQRDDTHTQPLHVKIGLPGFG